MTVVHNTKYKIRKIDKKSTQSHDMRIRTANAVHLVLLPAKERNLDEFLCAVLT